MTVERAKRTIVKQLAFGAEEIEGTEETLGVADMNDIQPENINFEPIPDFDENNAHRETMSRLPDTPGIFYSTLGFNHKVRGSGTAGLMPRWAQFLMFCGYYPVKHNANYYPPAPVAKNSNLSTGFTVACSGAFTGTGNRIWELEITTGGASGAAKLSATDLLGNGTTQTNLTITTAVGINIATEGVSVTFTGAGMSMNLGDKFLLRIYDYDTIEFYPVTNPVVISSGITATSGGTYTGGVDRLWYVYTDTAGVLDGSHGKIAAVCLLTGKTKAAAFVSTGVAIDLGDGEEFTLTGAGSLVGGASGDSWLMRVRATGAKVYDPVPHGTLGSSTFNCYEDGLLNKISGVRGSFTLDCNTGKAVMAAFNFMGAYIEPTDAAMLTGRTDRSITAPPFVNAHVKFGSWADAVVNALKIDSGSPATQRTSANAASGVLSYDNSRRNPSITADPEQVLVASKNFYSLMHAATTEHITMAWGSTAGNKIVIEAHTQYKGTSKGERDGKDIINLNGDLVGFGADDELRIWFQ